MTYLTILYLLHATGMRFGLLAVKGAVQVASQARGKKNSLPRRCWLLLAPSVHRAMAENQNMLVLLFGGAFGFFTAGFHLVAVLAGILLR